MSARPPCFGTFSLLSHACRDCAFRGPCSTAHAVGGFRVMHQPRYSAPPVVEIGPPPKTGRDSTDLLRAAAKAGLTVSGRRIRGKRRFVALVDSRAGYFMLHVKHDLTLVAALPAARLVEVRPRMDRPPRRRVKSRKPKPPVCTVLSPSEAHCVRILTEIVEHLP